MSESSVSIKARRLSAPCRQFIKNVVQTYLNPQNELLSSPVADQIDNEELGHPQLAKSTIFEKDKSTKEIKNSTENLIDLKRKHNSSVCSSQLYAELDPDSKHEIQWSVYNILQKGQEAAMTEQKQDEKNDTQVDQENSQYYEVDGEGGTSDI